MTRGDGHMQNAMGEEVVVSGSSGKGIFLVSLTIVGVIIVLGVYQVPQPWRGLLVAWLLFMGTGGVFVLRVVRHLLAYKSLLIEHSATQGRYAQGRRRDRSRSRPRKESLRVVRTDTMGTGRYVVR
jgi:hypothetical protein